MRYTKPGRDSRTQEYATNSEVFDPCPPTIAKQIAILGGDNGQQIYSEHCQAWVSNSFGFSAASVIGESKLSIPSSECDSLTKRDRYTTYEKSDLQSKRPLPRVHFSDLLGREILGGVEDDFESEKSQQICEKSPIQDGNIKYGQGLYSGRRLVMLPGSGGRVFSCSNPPLVATPPKVCLEKRNLSSRSYHLG